MKPAKYWAVNHCRSEGRRFAVPLRGCHGPGVGGIACRTSRFSELAVLSSFSFDALRAVLRARAPPLGHHCRPMDAPVVNWGLGNIELTGWDAQTWKQQSATGCRHIRLAIWKRENHGAVRKLLFIPAAERLHEVMPATLAVQVRRMRETTIAVRDYMVDVALARGDIAARRSAGHVTPADELGQPRAHSPVPAECPSG
jgi:hypothetical protein